jgi:hypothetical protein
VRISAVCFAAALLLPGCAKEPAEQAVFSEPALSRQYRQESVTVIVSVHETNITTSGKIRLMIDVHAPPADEVRFPDVGYFTAPFSVADGYGEPVQLLPNGKHLHRRVWILIPALPGEALFQPMQIDAGSVTLETDPIKVHVTSLLPQDLESFEIRDIADPIQRLPEEEQSRGLWLMLFGPAAVIIIAMILIRQLRRPPKRHITPPHEIALDALNHLPDDAVARIHELNRILRAYLEARYHLPAIGRTTNELIPVLEEVSSERLTDFLEASEQARFSNVIPETFSIEAEQLVRQFIDTTRREEPCD